MLTRRSLFLAALRPHRGMVRLPGGAFRMGADEAVLRREFPNAGEGLRSMLLAETPSREVTLRPFWMDRFEVTNAQFARFRRGHAPPGPPHLPVAFVTWHDAAAYAQWAGKRLASEAEWEFAARGGLFNPRYPWGSREPDPRLANYAGSGIGGAAAVGSYPPNPYGLHDLAGNVWEWCQDAWPGDAARRVIRGGSFAGGAFNLRVTARDSHRADHPVAHVGFRCVR